MCSINIQTLLDGKIFPQAGAELYDILIQNIDQPRIVLDMTGVTILPSMFLNMSIGNFIPQDISISGSRIKDYVRKYSSK